MALLTKYLQAMLRMRYPDLTHAGLLGRWRALLPAWFLLTNSIAVAAPPTEHEVKAAFIHNIAKFVEWPAGKDKVLRLCLMGHESLGAAAVLQGKAVGSRSWEVVPGVSRVSLLDCQVLFIPAMDGTSLRRILEDVRASPVLTVGDSEGYAEEGVIVNFYLEQNKVRFEINADAARRAGLKVSSQLLKLARIVKESGGTR